MRVDLTAAYRPATIEDAWRIATALHKAGFFSHRSKAGLVSGYTSPEQIFGVMMAGAEIGMGSFQSLNSFYLANGRPTLTGDGYMAVALKAGCRVVEEYDPGTKVATCRVTRGTQVVERTFSYAEAENAGLISKNDQYKRYLERMLTMRARAFAIRDACADVLRGIPGPDQGESIDAATITPLPFVAYESPQKPPETAPTRERKTAAKAKREGDYESILAEIANAETSQTLRDLWGTLAERVNTLPESWREPLSDAFDARLERLEGEENARSDANGLDEAFEDALERDPS